MLDDDDLHTFTLVGRWLHRSLMPRLLKRKGMQDPFERELSVSNDNTFKILQYLCRWLYYEPPSCAYFCISWLDERAASQCRAMLDFFSSKPLWQESIRSVLITFCSDLPPEHGRDVALAAIRSGVHRLQVRHEDPSQVVKRQKLTLSSDLFPTLHPHLHTLRLCAGLFFTKEAIPWTIGIINASALRDLTLQLNVDRQPCWSFIMQFISIPTLLSLTIEGRLSMLSLTDFLERHPGLEELKIGADSVSGLRTFQPMRLAPFHSSLSRLRVLEAPISYIVTLIGRTPDLGKQSNLMRLTILPDSQCRGFEFRPCVEHILREVADIGGLAWLTLHIPRSIGEGDKPWCQLSIPPYCPHPYYGLSFLAILQASGTSESYVFSNVFMVSFSL